MSAPLPLHIEATPGLPPSGAPGQFLGYDAGGAMWLLRWSRQEGVWHGLAFERSAGPEHPALRSGTELFPLIIGHVRGPDVAAEAKLCRSA